MHLATLLSAVYHEASLITPEAHSALRSLIEARLLRESIREPGRDICGNETEAESMKVQDGLACIPINGVVGQGLKPFERGSGAVDVLEVASEIEEAESSAEVSAVLFDIDSPGGMVLGTPELAARIAAMRKPTFAFSRSLIASAAYWIACSVRGGIFTTPSANIGSIGVYIPHIDQSEAYRKAGYSVEVIATGKYKGMGYPGTSLSHDQMQLLRERAAEIHRMFEGHVRARRPRATDPDTFQGQTFMASQALARGLVDYIVPDRETVIRMLSR